MYVTAFVRIPDFLTELAFEICSWTATGEIAVLSDVSLEHALLVF